MQLSIPRFMHQIWIGPNAPPSNWMQTWEFTHPDWSYRIWTNNDLENGQWINRKAMDWYWRHGLYAGVADLMRYEILYRYGGILVAADSVCLNQVDYLFLGDTHKLYTVSTVYPGNRHRNNTGATTPLYAAAPFHEFTGHLIAELHALSTRELKRPPETTGNRFMQRMLKKYKPEIQIWPMHYFIPEHFNGWRYSGPDRIYANHFWGTTRNTYEQGRLTK